MERAMPPPQIEAAPDAPLPDLDPKMLLLGDVAENGLWWTGKDGHSRSVGRRTRPENRHNEPGTGLVQSKNPQIVWSEVDQWYSLVVHPGKHWRSRLKETDLDESVGNPSARGIPVEEIEQSLKEASLRVQRTLLKAAESLLKRPGRPLKEPHNLRFLLILLANPLLYPKY